MFRFLALYGSGVSTYFDLRCQSDAGYPSGVRRRKSREEIFQDRTNRTNRRSKGYQWNQIGRDENQKYIPWEFLRQKPETLNQRPHPAGVPMYDSQAQ